MGHHTVQAPDPTIEVVSDQFSANWSRWLIYWRRSCYLDVRSLAALRIGLALVVMLNMLNRAPWLAEHYSDRGVLPRSAVLKTTETSLLPSVLMLDGGPLLAWCVLAATIIAALCLLIGLRSRWSAIACWLLLVSFNLRNLMVCNAGDQLLTCLLFWSMFLPLGATWSVDRLLARGSGPIPRRVSSLAATGLIVQLIAIYFFSGLHKLGPEWFARGNSLYYALHSDQLATSLGVWARSWPPVLLRLLTYGTLAMELFAWAFLFLPRWNHGWRILVVLTFSTFHLSIALLMSVGEFPYVAVAGWLAVLPSQFWNRLQKINLFRQRRIIAIPGSPSRRFALAGVPFFHLRAEENLLVAAALVAVLAANISALVPENLAPSYVQGALSAVGLSQKWDMFATPVHTPGWLSSEAEVADGTSRNILRIRDSAVAAPGDPDVPAYASWRWRKYAGLLLRTERSQHLSLFADWLRREWNAEHGEGEQVQSLVLRYNFKYLPPPGRGKPARGSVKLYEWNGTTETVLSRDQINAEIHRLTAAESQDNPPLGKPTTADSL